MSGGGLFVAIVGPSGAGKDSLIRALAQRADTSDVMFVRRVVTRAADAHEDHDTLDPAEFAAAERVGRFALSWRAHDLSYGVPIAADCAIAQGRIVVCNLSRAAVARARERYRDCLVVLVTASEEIRAARLARRGREGDDGQRSRLLRAGAPEAAATPDATIQNDGALEDAASRLYDLVMEHRASRAA